MTDATDHSLPDDSPPAFPLSLNAASGAWRVTAGHVDIFVVHTVDGEPAAPRQHVFRLGAGELVFPLVPIEVEHGALEFFAFGTEKTRIETLSARAVAGAYRSDPTALSAAVDQWAARLLQVLRPSRVDGTPQIKAVTPGVAGTVSDGLMITSSAGVLWVAVDAGAARIGARKDLDGMASGDALPLAPGVALEAVAGLEVRVMATAEILGTDDFAAALAVLHHRFGQAVATFVQATETERKRQAVQRNDTNDQVFSATLGHLAAVVDADTAQTDDLKWRLPMKRDVIFWTVLCLLVLLCLGWFGKLIHQTARNWQQRRLAATYRAETLVDYQGPIRIGVAAARRNEHDETFWNGMTLAAYEINEAGGVLGRTLELVGKNDKGRIDEARRIAQTFADDMTLSAVIGHRFSPISLSTAMIYEYYGLLMICPRTTSPDLTRQGYRRVFRTNLSGTTYGNQMADFANRMGYKRVMVLYIDDAFGKGVANAFEIHADELNMTIVDRVPHSRSYTSGDMQERIRAWQQNRKFDAIVMVTVMAYGPEFIRTARDAGIDQPMILHEALDSDRLIAAVGPDRSHDIYVASMFHPDSPFPMAKPFHQRYQKTYAEPPNGLSAQGYDAVYLLAHAMGQARSTVPDEVADVLRSTTEWYGVTGPHAFTPDGEMIKPLQFKTVRDGKFVLFRHADTTPSADFADGETGKK